MVIFCVCQAWMHKEIKQCSGRVLLHCLGAQTLSYFCFQALCCVSGNFGFYFGMKTQNMDMESHFWTSQVSMQVGQIWHSSLECQAVFLLLHNMALCGAMGQQPPTTGSQGATHRLGEPDKGTQGGPLATKSRTMASRNGRIGLHVTSVVWWPKCGQNYPSTQKLSRTILGFLEFWQVN